MKNLKKFTVIATAALLTLSTAVQAKKQIKSAARSEIQQAIAEKALIKSSNMIMSTVSIDGLIGLVAPGYNESVQKDVMTYFGLEVNDALETLGTLNYESEFVKVKSAKNIFARKEFKFYPKYLADVKDLFNVVPENMDFNKPDAVAKRVNEWASDNTDGLITKVIEKDFINSDLQAILADALLFDGKWDVKFDKLLTKKDQFLTSKGELIQTDMMSRKASSKAQNKLDYSVIDFDDTERKAIVVNLPYKGDRFSMVVAMSADVKRTEKKIGRYDREIKNVIKASSNITAYDLLKDVILSERLNEINFITNSLTEFTMPKFDVTSEHNGIESHFADAGLASMVSGGLSNLGAGRIALDIILQKARIIVDENGSKAAAVTIGGMRTTSVGTTTYTNIVKLNGSFAYAIKDNKTGTVLFHGVLGNPSLKK